MTAYWIAHVTVHDEDGYAAYVKVAGECVKAHGGRFLARGGRYVTMEGPDHPRNVLAEFPTLEDAVACYQSDAYQSVVGLAKASAERTLCIVEAG